MVTAKGLQSLALVSVSQEKEKKVKKKIETTWDLFISPAQFCDLWGATQDQMASQLPLAIKFTGLPLNCKLLQP